MAHAAQVGCAEQLSEDAFTPCLAILCACAATGSVRLAGAAVSEGEELSSQAACRVSPSPHLCVFSCFPHFPSTFFTSAGGMKTGGGGVGGWLCVGGVGTCEVVAAVMELVWWEVGGEGGGLRGGGGCP